MVLTRHSEKQLLCMARAILKRAKVLVMDEVRVLRLLQLAVLVLTYVIGDRQR